MLMHVLEPAPELRTANPQLPPGIEPVIAKALAKTPEERFASAGEMVQALQAALQGTQSQPAASSYPVVPPQPAGKSSGMIPEATLLTPSRGLPPVNPPPAMQPRRRTSWLVIGGVAIGIVLLAVIGYAVLGRRSSATPALALDAPASPTTQPVAALQPTPLPPSPTVAVIEPTIPPVVSPTTQPVPTQTPAPTELPTELPTGTPPPDLAIPVVGGADKIALLNDNDIWITNLDGSELTQLTNDGAEKSSLQWSPDGQAVHYILGKCINSVDINTLRIDNLACFESADFLEAFEISPDGQRVAISLNRELFVLPYDREKLSQAKYRRDLQAMADCEILAPYSHNDKIIAVKSVRWSRDGQQIAVVRKGVDNGQQVDLVHLLDIAECAAPIHRLDEFPATRFKMKDYAVSPIIENLAWDGTYLFTLNSFKRNDGFGDLWIYSTELHRAYQAAPIDEGCCYRDAAFSPDGSHLLFVFQDMSKTPENVIKLYYVAYASLGTGMKYAPLPLPEDFFSDPRARPMPVLRPAR
jgi:dipeptidyl aminopeptidase/acylaminoacyl peptidase